MIKKIKTAMFNRPLSIKGNSSKEKQEINNKNVVNQQLDSEPKSARVNLDLKISKTEETKTLKLDEILNKLDVLTEREAIKIEESNDVGANLEIAEIEEYETEVDNEKLETEIINSENKYSKSDKSNRIIELESSLSEKYQSVGYSVEESKTIIELQKMNRKAISIDEIFEKKILMSVINQLWANEYILDTLFEDTIKHQTTALIYFGLVKETKVNKTLELLEALKSGATIYKNEEIKAMDLYYEKELIALNELSDKIVVYSSIKHQLAILRRATNQFTAEQDIAKIMWTTPEALNSEIEIITGELIQKTITSLLQVDLGDRNLLNGLTRNVLKNKKVLNHIDLDANHPQKENVEDLEYSVISNEDFDNIVAETTEAIEDIEYKKEKDQLKIPKLNLVKQSGQERREYDELVEPVELEVVLNKAAQSIDYYGFDEFSKEYILQKYELAGLSKTDAELLVDLQEKNYNLLDIKTVIDSEIPSAYLKNLWFNEVLNEFLFKIKIENQTLIIVRYNLVDKLKLMDTQIVIDKIILGKEKLKESEIRRMDLYFEDELVEMTRCNPELLQQYYEKLHESLILFNKALEQGKATLESTGKLYGVTKERIRQVDKKITERLNSISKSEQSHLNPKFLLGLNALSLAVLGHKPFKEVDYFLEGIVKPTQYFVDEYNLKTDYFIYKGKVLPQNNKALFDEYMANLDNDNHSADEILNDFLDSLKSEGIYEVVMKRDVVDIREIKGRLARTENIIHSGKYYRKHNIKASEIEELVTRVENLDLPNVFSSKLLINSGVVEDLDIRDENELHNILKQNSDLFSMDIVFTRMPHMMLGNFDMIEELYQLVDIDMLQKDVEETYKKLEEITGIKEKTLLGTYNKKILQLLSNSDIQIDDIDVLETKLNNLELDIVHLDVLEEKYDIALSNKVRDIMKIKTISGYKLQSNWVIKEQYNSAADFIKKNVDEYGIFSEDKLGASRFVHNYQTLKNSLKRKNIFKLNNSELIYITDEELIHNLENLKEDVLYSINFPVAYEALVESEEFETIVAECGLDVYGFSNIFWKEVLISIADLKLDGEILVKRNQPIVYQDYIDGFVCSVYDYEEEFSDAIGCEPPSKYIRKLEEEGVFIKDDVIYLEKEIYLNELRSVA